MEPVRIRSLALGRLLVAGSVVLAITLPAICLPASASVTPQPTSRSSLNVSGLAGTAVRVRIPRTVYLNNAGADVALSSPGSAAVGVLVARTDDNGKYADQDFYQETYGGDLGLCGHSPCAVPAPVRTWAWGAQTSGAIRLRPGSYLIVLLAESGQPVTAHFRLAGLPGGTSLVKTSGAVIGQLTVEMPEITAQGHDVVARGYSMYYSKHRLFAGNLAMMSFGSPGLFDYESCGDIGDGPPPPQPTLCLSGGGFNPNPTVTTQIGGTIYGTAAPLAYGPPDGHYGLGYTIDVAAPGTPRIRVATYHVTLPW